jgi:putative FmdB family regulatory protein
MPTYVYKILKTGKTFEVEQRITEAAWTKHPQTGAAVERVIQAAGIVFKGSGFYKTDSRPSEKSAGKKEKKADADSGSSTSASSDSSKSDSSKSDSSKSESSSSDSSKSDSSKSDSSKSDSSKKAASTDSSSSDSSAAKSSGSDSGATSKPAKASKKD